MNLPGYSSVLTYCEGQHELARVQQQQQQQGQEQQHAHIFEVSEDSPGYNSSSSNSSRDKSSSVRRTAEPGVLGVKYLDAKVCRNPIDLLSLTSGSVLFCW